MPVNIIQYPATYACEFNNSYTRSDCPVVADNCVGVDLTCGWMLDPEDSYNCTRCGSDKPFTVPYVRGDQIQFQTQLTDTFNANPTTPVFGWSGAAPLAAFEVWVLDCDGNFVASDVDDFCSDYIVGYGCGTSYQGLVIDTQELFNRYGVTCFSLRIASKIDLGGGPVDNAIIYSEEYCEVNCDDEPAVLSGEWDKFDCCGNYYGLPDFVNGFQGTSRYQFDNTRRYYGKVLQTGFTTTKEVFQDNVTKSTILKLSEFQLTRPIPPYYANYFSNVLYGSKVFTIDDIEYTATGFVNNRLDRSGTMFLFDAELQEKCEKDFNCI